MSDKPSYLGLLNAIAVAEGEAECYLQAWAEVTPSDDVRQVLTTVALREGEHAKAFAKRMCELGFTVQERSNSKAEDRMRIAASPDMTDREKFERFDLTGDGDADGKDVFSDMFHDRTIDIQTGALLGRYIAEERDSGRLLRSCYAALCEADRTGGNGAGGEVASRLDRIEEMLDQLLTRQAKRRT
jgi:rubrerythrin